MDAVIPERFGVYVLCATRLQAYQRLLHSLIGVYHLWKLGRKEDVQRVKDLVRDIMGCMDYLCKFLNQEQLSPKLHDLQHIPMDMNACGGSLGYSTGPVGLIVRTCQP